MLDPSGKGTGSFHSSSRMGKFSESVSGWFRKGSQPVDEDILSKGVVWNARGEMQSCLFCDFAQHSKEKELLFEDDLVAAFAPKKPAAKQHILVIPKKHISTVGDLVEADTAVLDRMKSVADGLLKCDASDIQYSFHIPPWNSIGELEPWREPWFACQRSLGNQFLQKHFARQMQQQQPAREMTGMGYRVRLRIGEDER